MDKSEKINILVVDDDEGDTLMVKEALEESFFSNNLYVVHDGIDAIKFMEKKEGYEDVPSPDLILLDINMPKMNGYDVLRWMRSQELYKYTPVIVLITSNSQADVIKSYQNKANCFVTKPIELNQFNNVIKVINEFWSNIATLPKHRGF